MANDAGSWIKVEEERVETRRRVLSVKPPKVSQDGDGAWGLALSGGGIRSATFSLGLLQALAQSNVKLDVDHNPEVNSKDEQTKPGGWLRCFDYLSTVSGGGYIGAFFISLFVPGRLQGTRSRDGGLRGYAANLFRRMRTFRGFRTFFRLSSETPLNLSPSEEGKQAASDAYRVLLDDPPGRVRSRDRYDPFRRPLSWLRENGRYLTPTGAGDFFYAIGLAIRNWLSLHYVVGTVFLFTYTLIFFCKAWLARHFVSLLHVTGVASVVDKLAGGQQTDFFSLQLWQAPDPNTWSLWWSPLWVIPAAVVVLWLVPSVLAYWQTWSGEADPGPPGLFGRLWRISTLATWFDIGIAAVLFWGVCALHSTGDTGLRAGIGLAATVLTLGIVFHAFASIVCDSAEAQRVAQTRWLATGLKAFIALVVVATFDTLAQTFYLWLTTNNSIIYQLLTPSAGFAIAVWLLRKIPTAFAETAKPSWLSKIPLDMIALAAATILLLVVASAWAVLAQWVIWSGEVPRAVAGACLAAQSAKAGWLSLVALGLCLINGRFPNFINLSTLQAFYSARLTRAYLGASNGARFTGDEKRKWNSAAEPHPADPIPRTEYYGDNVLSPIHLINVTMDQTVDPAEQLVQRDRKGKPLAVGPVGYLLDGQYKPYNSKTDDYSIGEWVGVSGAAFTTGLGRATSLGMSLLLGLINVRLGVWWQSIYGRWPSSTIEKILLSIFPTQVYLAYEFISRFHGDHRMRQYLSDGGHFENTAVYELLRREREVSFIVTSDNGCDSNYRFDDVANLIRLARIDHGAHFDLITDFAKDSSLSDVFGTPADFDRKLDGTTNTCALLYRVSYPQIPGLREGRSRWLVVVKPRLVKATPLDVWQYHRENRDFPQQTTADQFFDEAQWESYRKLGLVIGDLIFNEHGAELLYALVANGSS